MKTYIKAALCILLSGGFASCSDWFDVSPKTDIKADEFFSTEAGFQSALIGIYVQMSARAGYGANYTFGFMDQLTQRYDKHPLVNPSDQDRAVIYEYTEDNGTYNSKNVLAVMWNQSYTCIANANNLLSWLDKRGDRVVLDKVTRDHMRGEALALRALLHFDLLRGWGPCYRSDSTERAIPYRLVVSNEKLPRLRANVVVAKIVDDLRAAEKLMLDQENFDLGSIMNKSSRYRLNLHAVRALLARVCSYRNDKKEAVRYANEVISKSGLQMVTVNAEDPALFGETIFALNRYDLTVEVSGDFVDAPPFTNHKYITTENLSDLYEVAAGIGNNDIRYRHNYGFMIFGSQQQAIVRKYLKSQNSIPIIRLAEMYYILCENMPLAESASWINFVRNKRGISNSINYGSFADDASRLEALSLEYRKEFYAEGQYFFFLKLHEMKSFFRCPSAQMTKKEYVFPLPDNEKEHGWTDEEQEDENVK